MAADSFKGALLGPQLYDKIKATIARVDGTPVGGSISRIPTRIDDGVQQPGNSLKFAAFTGTSAWVVGSPRQVFMMERADDTAAMPAGVMSTSNTASAYSCLFSIPGNTSTASISTSLVAITRLNGNWQVIAAVAN